MRVISQASPIFRRRQEAQELGVADYNRVTASRSTAVLIRTSWEVNPVNTMVRALMVTQTSRVDCAKSYFVCRSPSVADCEARSRWAYM